MDTELSFPKASAHEECWGIEASYECEHKPYDPFIIRVVGEGSGPTDSDIAKIISAAAERVRMCENCPRYCLVNQLSRTWMGQPSKNLRAILMGR